jgi:Cu(I)/Ag(I) efflux system membrane protein CusA/SilA
MLERVIRFCAANRLFVIAVVAALVAASVYSMRSIRLDAIPDLSDTQVIVYTTWDRSPDIVEDQVTRPIITSLVGAPGVKAIRGFSDFGFSFVYVVFEDGTDIYWARSRVVEYLSKLTGMLPAGVAPQIGPDASGVGWVFQYVLVDRSGKRDLSELRSYQDWTLRYLLQSVPGVAEVASIGGYQKQYQVLVDPVRLQGHNLTLADITRAVEAGNNEVGGRLIEWNGREYMVRASGYVTGKDDIGAMVVKTSPGGAPLHVRDVAEVALGPQLRRGVLDFNGDGETVGGIVVMRHGENALNVIQRVREKIAEVRPSLPEGVEIVTAYDRSDLIRRSIDNLTHELIAEMVIVSLVILFFLWHIPSAIVPIITIPVSVALSFIPMYLMGITSNIMSLAGIAISIGVLVDGAIVEVENAYKRLELWNIEGRVGDYHKIRLDALVEVAPSVFFSLLVIAVSFLPVFTLVDQEGRLFKPLAYTKTLAIAIAALLAVTLDPAVRMLFTRMDPFRLRPRWAAGLLNAVAVGRYYPEEKHPVSGVLFALYERPCRWVLRHPKFVIAASAAVVLSTVPVYLRLGHEFMPPLNEEVILYMPTTVPGISVTDARRLLQTQDRILKTFPEVASVFGKAGRADTSTDPAPLSMIETTVVLKPKDQWRTKERWYSKWAPGWARSVLGHVWPEHISYEELVSEMDKAVKVPGCVNAWTMPIKGRIDMLSTGVRTTIGIKIFGRTLADIDETGRRIEAVLTGLPNTRGVFAERAEGGYFVDIVPDRERLARHGVTLQDLQSVVMTAIGGETVTTTIEGRERFSVNVRYARDFRSDVDELERMLVAAPNGHNVPIGSLADVRLRSGPAMIRDENGSLAGYVYVDVIGSDVGGYVESAKREVAEKVPLPTGCSLAWSGQYENMLRVRERLKVVVPLALLLIVLLLYLNTKSFFKTMVVLLAVPFSLVGAVWLLYVLGYNVSIAVWVGMIALMGLDAETGIFMLLFLDLSHGEAKRAGRLNTLADLHEAIVHGAVKRIRPKLMTVAAASIGLMPIMWSVGTGADMMKRVAAPMVGGLATSFIMELLVYPAIYLLWRKRELPAGREAV